MGMELGRIGIWSIELRFGDPAEASRAATELEALGFGAIWIPGAIDDRILADVDRLLDATSTVAIGTGIINVWKVAAADVGRWWQALPADRRARLMLGFGVSHGPAIGEQYGKPLATMAAYLDGLDATGVPAAHRCLAALGPKMLDLARDRTAGAHPYLVTARHTAEARERLGPGGLLAPEQGVILETDPARARAIGRAALSSYQHFPNYKNNWRRLGYTEEDIVGSDRLIDDLFLWGDHDRITAGVQAHFDAGADHVCLQLIRGEMGSHTSMPIEEWRTLARMLL
nr:TIGR03620 family F420-dependent LLM class oxidoreductase [Sphingomonas sp. Y57]